MGIHLVEFRHNIEDNVWYVKCYMCDKERNKAEFESHSCGEKVEKKHQRYSRYDLGIDDRHIGNVHYDRSWNFSHTVYADSGESTEGG